jgi:hypothetical protein
MLNVYEQQVRIIEVFNRGRMPAAFTAQSSDAWLHVSPEGGRVTADVRLTVRVDWQVAPTGRHDASVTIRGAGDRTFVVTVPIFKPEAPGRDAVEGFVETGGLVSMEAEHYSRAVQNKGIHWETIEDYGRTLSGVTPFPVTAPSLTPSPDSPRLEYKLYLFSPGELTVDLYVAPTLDFVPGRGLRCAVSFDDAPAQVVDAFASRSEANWERSVEDAVRKLSTRHHVANPGPHVLKFWMVDPGVVLEKIVVDAGGVKPSYLGPPESFHNHFTAARQ